MELHYEASLSAYIILHEVVKEFKSQGTVSENNENEYAKKIFRRCTEKIDKRYRNNKNEILKSYISNILMDEYGVTNLV